MAPPVTSRRRWFRFSLRTLFVLVTFFAVSFGWARNWIRQRREFLATRHVWVSEDAKSVQLAPGPLGWFGEVGIGYLDLYPGYTPPDLATARSLFPESEIGFVPPAPPADPAA